MGAIRVREPLRRADYPAAWLVSPLRQASRAYAMAAETDSGGQRHETPARGSGRTRFVNVSCCPFPVRSMG